MTNLQRLVDERGDQLIVAEHALQVAENPQLEALVAVYEEWLHATSIHVDPSFALAKSILSLLDYSAKDVTDLSIKLSAYQQHEKFSRSGLFLSALVNNGKELKYEVVTEHLNYPLSWLGFENSKELLVIGDAGNFLGKSMSGGSLELMGNAGQFAGEYLHEGSIVIWGNVDELFGHWMRSGSVEVHGNVGDYGCNGIDGGSITVHGDMGLVAGQGMDGGILQVDGKIEGISKSWRGGEIWRKGRLVRGSPRRWGRYILRGEWL